MLILKNLNYFFLNLDSNPPDMSEFTDRRIQLVFTLSLVSAVFAIIFFIVGLGFNLNKLGFVHLATGTLLALNAFIVKKGYLNFSRIAYFIVFNLGVFLTALSFGKEASVEFFLIFSLAVPFFIFSFNYERKKILSFVFFALILWIILYATDFNLFNLKKIDVEIASTYFYPLSIIFSILLVSLILQYFSFLNGTHYANAYLRKKQAIEASEAKSKFLSMMSHEVRTPLNAIVGLSHILYENDPRKDQKENIEALNISGKLLMGLLTNVLDFSKMQSTKIELDNISTDMYAAVKQIKKIHQVNCDEKGIEFKMLIDSKIPTVILDIVRFNQILNNLIRNAIKFTSKGSVSLRIKKGTETQNKVNVIVEVLDTGIGIPENKMQEIWEPFSQASNSTTRVYGGTGLGLPIVKSIVEAMGSKIYVKSKVGKGSRFYFKLSLNKVKEIAVQKEKNKNSYSFENKEALLVDDNLINIMVGKQLLEKEHLKVTIATGGEDAVLKAKAQNFDIILMDLQMPDMDGYSASKSIREFNTKTPILALSGEVFSEVKDKIADSGMNGFILKPFDPVKFLEQIDEVIKKNS